MTTSLKAVRESPLLSPPRGFRIPEVTEADAALMREKLEKARNDPKDWSLPDTLHALKRLGVDFKEDDGDLGRIRKDLDRARKEGRGDYVASIHDNLRRLGEAAEVTENDRRLMGGGVKQAKAD